MMKYGVGGSDLQNKLDFIAYSFNGRFHMMPEDQVSDFFEDNALEDNSENRATLRFNLMYLKILQELHQIDNHFPLYFNPQNPTRYMIPQPPRTLNSFNPNLASNWKRLVDQVKHTFAFLPNHPEPAPRSYYDPFEKAYQQDKNFSLGQDFFLQNGCKILNYIWIEQLGVLYPYSLHLSIEFSFNSFNSRISTAICRDSVIKEAILKHLSILEHNFPHVY